ncbi:DUF6210 family protein [Sorangium sp. So ce385]|uniref:DUF6210 family protein n=1 Tax=Sorangium sp. So ce385 TaxID=3133308 RepID=UPI003F5BF5D7
MLELQVGARVVFAHYLPADAGPNNGGYLGLVYPGGTFYGVGFDELRALGTGRHQLALDERARSERGREPEYESEWQRQFERFQFMLFSYSVGAYVALEVLSAAREIFELECRIGRLTRRPDDDLKAVMGADGKWQFQREDGAPHSSSASPSTAEHTFAVSSSSKRHVHLDPDGTWRATWLVVVVEAPTGVLYEQQCAGTGCDDRAIEGYLVPLGGLKVDASAGFIEPDELTSVFHDGSACVWGMCGDRLPHDRLGRLRQLVRSVPYWHRRDDGEEVPSPLELDERRLGELAEAWVPVITPDGPGILMWHNCD